VASVHLHDPRAALVVGVRVVRQHPAVHRRRQRLQLHVPSKDPLLHDEGPYKIKSQAPRCNFIYTYRAAGFLAVALASGSRRRLGTGSAMARRGCEEEKGVAAGAGNGEEERRRLLFL